LSGRLENNLIYRRGAFTTKTLPTPETFPSPERAVETPTPTCRAARRSVVRRLLHYRIRDTTRRRMFRRRLWRGNVRVRSGSIVRAGARARVCAWTSSVRVRPTDGACVCVNERERPSPCERVWVRACLCVRVRVRCT